MPLYQLIFETFWFLLPAGVANAMPVIAAHHNWLPALNRPLDFNATMHGCRVLGSNKTWRGLIIGTITGSIVGLLQGFFIAGILLSLGALLGDAAGSFLKRQLSIAPGKSWPIFDQIDYIIGALLLGAWLLPLTLNHIMIALIMFGLLSYLTSFIGVRIKIKKSL